MFSKITHLEKIGDLKTWHFALFSVFFTIILVAFLSMYFHGKITYDYVITGTIVSLIVSYLIIGILKSYQDKLEKEIERRIKTEQEKENVIKDLRVASNAVIKLSGLLPICSSCKKIRDGKGYWNQVESYIRDHSEAEFTHSICPDCARKLYPDFIEKPKDVNTSN